MAGFKFLIFSISDCVLHHRDEIIGRGGSAMQNVGRTQSEILLVVAIDLACGGKPLQINHRSNQHLQINHRLACGEKPLQINHGIS